MLQRIVSLQNLLRIRFLLGYYYHSNSSKIISGFKVFYCLLYFITLVFIYLNEKSFDDIGFFKALLPVKYGAHFFIALYSKEIYLTKYASGLRTIDYIIHYKGNHFDPYKTFISMCTLIAFKHFYDSMLNVHESSFTIKYIGGGFLKTSNHLCCVPTVIIFEMFWSRMRFIRRKLTRTCKDKSVYEKCFAIKKFLHVYKLLLDNYKPTNAVVKITTLIDLVYYFIKTVNYNQIGLTHIFREGFNRLGLFYTLQSCFGLYAAVSTPLFQELVLSEYKKMRAILANELIACEDKTLHNVINTAIEYLEIRPPKRTLYRVLPMDVNLVTSFISAIITYIVIIMSFKT